jgi:ribosomal protein L16/L10AE
MKPKTTRFRKAFKGFYKSKSGGSQRGTTVRFGDYGLRVMEGGRLSDKQLDVARSNAKRALKSDKNSKLYMR